MFKYLMWPFSKLLRVLAWFLLVFVDWMREKNYQTLSSQELPLAEDPLREMRYISAMWTMSHGVRLASMEYKDFLKTYYWRVIRQYVLHTRGLKCQLCKTSARRGNLHLHHETYVHHGSEHLHLRDLTVLCQDCHLEVHSK